MCIADLTSIRDYE